MIVLSPVNYLHESVPLINVISDIIMCICADPVIQMY